jgi:hypothetical protein
MSQSDQPSLREQLEAEKRSRIEELLSPHRARREELEGKRNQHIDAVEKIDAEIAEIDAAIEEIEGTSGRKRAAAKKKATKAREEKPAVNEDWVIQKLRERPVTPAELAKLAKAEGFNGRSAKDIAQSLEGANRLRRNGEQYELAA